MALSPDQPAVLSTSSWDCHDCPWLPQPHSCWYNCSSSPELLTATTGESRVNISNGAITSQSTPHMRASATHPANSPRWLMSQCPVPHLCQASCSLVCQGQLSAVGLPHCITCVLGWDSPLPITSTTVSLSRLLPLCPLSIRQGSHQEHRMWQVSLAEQAILVRHIFRVIF